MKLSKRQLRKLINEMFTVGPDGSAMYLDPYGESPLETEERLRNEYVKDFYPDRRISNLAKGGPDFLATARSLTDTVDDYQGIQLSPEQEIAQAMYDKDAVNLPSSFSGRNYSDEYLIVKRHVKRLMEDELNKISPIDDLSDIEILDRIYDAGLKSNLLKKMLGHFDNLSYEEQMTDGSLSHEAFLALAVNTVEDVNEEYKITDYDNYIRWRGMINYM